jgi:hypothetical protein
MLADSAIERKIATNVNLGIPRFNKRILYYIYKITFLQTTQRSLQTTRFGYRARFNNQVEFELYN